MTLTKSTSDLSLNTYLLVELENIDLVSNELFEDH